MVNNKTVRSKRTSTRSSVGGKRRKTRRSSVGKKARKSRRSSVGKKTRKSRRRSSGGGWFSKDPCAAVKGSPLPTKVMGFYEYGTHGDSRKGTYTGNMKEYIQKTSKGYVVKKLCHAHGEGKWVSDDGMITLEGTWENNYFKGDKPEATQRKMPIEGMARGNSKDVWTDESGKECSKTFGKVECK